MHYYRSTQKQSKQKTVAMIQQGNNSEKYLMTQGNNKLVCGGKQKITEKQPDGQLLIRRDSCQILVTRT
jgi:hypothetical protein